MKKLFAFSFFSFSLLLGLTPSKADWTHYVTDNGGRDEALKLYLYNSKDQSKSLLSTIGPYADVDGDIWTATRSSGINNGNFWVEVDVEGTWTVFEYNRDKDKWTNKGEKWENNWDEIQEISLIRRNNNTGVTSIGQNSLNFKETDKKLDLWGTNLDGEKVPINITSGLTIDGMNVKESIEDNTDDINKNKKSIKKNKKSINTNTQSIKNVGAMSAALTGLPTVPTDTKIACGLGTGAYGGNFAFSGGCASKVNERLSINYAASVTMPGQEYDYNFEDTFSARAGFVWQLGESNKPSQISMNQKKEMDLKISKLEKDNKELNNKNNEIISQNAKLLARLEKLENIAFKFQKEEKYKLSKSISK